MEINVVAFIGPETLPLPVGQAQGFYEAEGLRVRCEAATGSAGQMVRLIDGGCDMVMTAVDNIVAYAEGQGAARPKNPPDPVAVLGSASEPRPLIVAPEIPDFAGLRGGRIAVDAVNTGFSFLLRQLLEDHGLGPDDYTLLPVGAPPARWEAIRGGDCCAGLLSVAIAETARREGYRELRADPDPWENYQGGVYAARRSWAAENRDAVAGFIRATLRAVTWIRDPRNRNALPDLLMRHLPHMTPAAAEAAADDLQSQRSLLQPGLPVNMDGMRAVIALRAKYGEPPAALGGPEKYLDLRYYDEAVRSAE